jgi:DNA polymerase
VSAEKLELPAAKRRVLAALDIPVWRLRDSGNQPLEPNSSSPAADQTAPTDQTPPPALLTEIDRLDWASLRSRVSDCRACALAEQRTQTVFGVGDESADWLFVGEAPGQEEDQRGEPFVGRSGELLNNMLRAIGLTREQVYIANIVKCRPPNNRDPHVDERQACNGYLARQIALLEPKIIVAVGRVAAHALLDSDEAVGKLRHREFSYGGGEIPLVVTYHPAYLLRSALEKSKVWEDLCYARERYNE